MVVVDNIPDDFEVAKVRYRRRIDCRSILFVRSWREILHTPANSPEHCIPDVPKYPFIAMLDAIERCFPHIRFQVLFVNYGDQEVDDPRALFANVRTMDDVVDRTGSMRGWDQLLTDHPLISTS